MISDTLSTDERIPLIKSIFSDRDEVAVFEYLSGDDAQGFVDVIDEVSSHVFLPLKKIYWSSNARICIPCRLGVGQRG